MIKVTLKAGMLNLGNNLYFADSTNGPISVTEKDDHAEPIPKAKVEL